MNSRVGTGYHFKVLGLLVFLLSAGAFHTFPQASAQELITFNGPPIEPSAFKKKRAKAKGIELKALPGRKIEGKLVVPEGEMRFPTAVIMSSSHGVNTSHIAWANKLKNWGIASLIVDGGSTDPAEVLYFLLEQSLASLSALTEARAGQSGHMAFPQCR